MPKNLWLDDEENKTLRSKRANGGIILADHQRGYRFHRPHSTAEVTEATIRQRACEI